MRTWVVLLCLGHVSVVLLPPGAQAKRFDPSMVDPLSRRSSLDKNFMRFGRSSPSFTEEDRTEDAANAISGAETNKEDNFLRSMRGKDNFIRFGRTRNDNFMRFGRGKKIKFTRYGKDVDDDLLRASRGKQDSFMRFGRGKEDKFLKMIFSPIFRNESDTQETVQRKQPARRGKQDNFMTFGREVQDRYLRYGKGKQDSYMRFGRDHDVGPRSQSFKNDELTLLYADTLQNLMNNQGLYTRFGKSLADYSDINVPVAMRSSGSNFMRFGRAKHDNVMRFGKLTDKKNLLPSNEENQITEEGVPKNARYITFPDFFSIFFPKQPNVTKRTRDCNVQSESSILNGCLPIRRQLQIMSQIPSESVLSPPRIKRSFLPFIYESQENVLPEKQQNEVYGHIVIPLSSIQDDLEEEYSSQDLQENYVNRKKRFVYRDSSTSLPLVEEDSSVDYMSAKLQIDSPAIHDYQSTLLSAGLPNVIVGPEFSILPDLDPPSKMLKRGRLGKQNFLRLG